MTYLKRSNYAAKRSRAATIGAISLLALLFAVHYVFPGFFSGILSPIASFAWATEGSAFGWIGSMAEVARSKASLVAENEGLKRQIAERDDQARLLSIVQAENEDLKGLLGRKAAAKSTDVLGTVLSRPPASPYDSIVIDIGSKDGVQVGDKAYISGSILIGDVAEANSGSSKVSLFSTPGRTTTVLLGEKHIEAQATGRGGGNFSVKLPVDSKIAVGDAVMLPQLRDHVFGLVEKISADSTDSLQTVLFKAPVNVSELRFVEVEIRK